MAASAGRRHHLVALWPVAWREALADHLDRLPADAATRAFGVLAFAGPRGMREQVFAAEPLDPFFNVNTPDDQALAQLVRP